MFGFFYKFLSTEKVLELIRAKDVSRLLHIGKNKPFDAAVLQKMISSPKGLEIVLEVYICRCKTFGMDGDLKFIFNHGR